MTSFLIGLLVLDTILICYIIVFMTMNVQQIRQLWRYHEKHLKEYHPGYITLDQK